MSIHIYTRMCTYMLTYTTYIHMCMHTHVLTKRVSYLKAEFYFPVSYVWYLHNVCMYVCMYAYMYVYLRHAYAGMADFYSQ